MFLGDYHTHTVYSHGKGTVEDNVRAAVAAGLKQIAITDHGFRHLTYNVRRADWPHVMADVAACRVKYPDIEILLGLETNFHSLDGHVDIMPGDMRYLDIVVCGYHKLVAPKRAKDFFGLYFPNFFLNSFGKSTAKQTVRNTDAYIKALGLYEIDIISHINHGCRVDAKAVAEAAAEYGTYIELNCKNMHGGQASMTDAELQEVLTTKAEFVVDSDAHAPDKVGRFDRAVEIIERVGIPYERIANYDRLPAFRSRRAP